MNCDGSLSEKTSAVMQEICKNQKYFLKTPSPFQKIYHLYLLKIFSLQKIFATLLFF